MAIRIEVIDTSQGPADARTSEIELPAVPRIGETIHFYDDDKGGGEWSITVKAVLWLPQSGEAQVQIRGW
jgi:hypothetical protein